MNLGAAEPVACPVDSCAGRLRIRWDDAAAVAAGLWHALAADGSLRNTRPNAPSLGDTLGALLMSEDLPGAHSSGPRQETSQWLKRRLRQTYHAGADFPCGAHRFDTLPPASRPAFIRSEIGWGAKRMMREAEQRGHAHLFEIRQSAEIRALPARSFAMDPWEPAGQGWEGTWSSKRRLIRQEPARWPNTAGIGARRRPNLTS
jgi:hypothetical protein